MMFQKMNICKEIEIIKSKPNTKFQSMQTFQKITKVGRELKYYW